MKLHVRIYGTLPKKKIRQLREQLKEGAKKRARRDILLVKAWFALE